MAEIPKLSSELFVIPLSEGRFVIYAPLRRAAFVTNARGVNFLADLRESRFERAADADGALVDFLRQLEILDGGPESAPVTTFSGVPEPTEVTLFLTTTCNLRCTYCYASAGDTPARNMSLATAKRGIDFVAGNAQRRGLSRFAVNYHGGGEPTGNWSALTESFEYACARAAELGLEPPVAAAASNGVLRAEQVTWMIENLAGGVSISFDGRPEAHDRHRLTVQGQGSSERVMRTMRTFDEAAYPYGIRMTVTADQIARLADSVAFVCANFNPRRIQVEPAYQLGRWSDAPSAETDAFVAAYRDAQLRAKQHGREIFFSAARVGALTNHFCGVTQDAFSLSPDGNVSACYEVFAEDSPLSSTFFYGEPDEQDGYRFKLPVLQDLRSQAVQHRGFCQGCFAKWTCGGDCYHKAVSVTGKLAFEGTDRCHITRALTLDQILERIRRSGGVFWHEGALAQECTANGKEALL
jgi:uncharacterized protein